MDGFEKNFNDLDVVDEFTREATSSATAVGTPQDDVGRPCRAVRERNVLRPLPGVVERMLLALRFV